MSLATSLLSCLTAFVVAGNQALLIPNPNFTPPLIIVSRIIDYFISSFQVVGRVGCKFQ